MPSSALSDLDLALTLLEKGADHSRHAKLILVCVFLFVFFSAVLIIAS